MFVDGRCELLQFVAANFLVLEPKIFFLEKNPIRCDFLLFRLFVTTF